MLYLVVISLLCWNSLLFPCIWLPQSILEVGESSCIYWFLVMHHNVSLWLSWKGYVSRWLHSSISLAVFLALRFTLMTWSLVWFLHQPEQQLLVFWNTQQQIDSGPKCSLRTFLLPAFPCAFLGQAHGESSRKSYCLKLQWLFNHCGLPENRSGLQSCLWRAHYQFVYRSTRQWRSDF